MIQVQALVTPSALQSKTKQTPTQTPTQTRPRSHPIPREQTQLNLQFQHRLPRLLWNSSGGRAFVAYGSRRQTRLLLLQVSLLGCVFSIFYFIPFCRSSFFVQKKKKKKDNDITIV